MSVVDKSLPYRGRDLSKLVLAKLVLMQSVIATSIFYGYGLGLAGQVGAAAGVLLTVGIFAAQMIFSWLWFKSFAFGPAEWLWRRLMYGRGVPLRSASSGQ